MLYFRTILDSQFNYINKQTKILRATTNIPRKALNRWIGKSISGCGLVCTLENWETAQLKMMASM